MNLGNIICYGKFIWTNKHKALWEIYLRMTRHMFPKLFMFPVCLFSQSNMVGEYHIFVMYAWTIRGIAKITT